MSTPENSDCANEMTPGKIGWSELSTSDPAAAISYYTKMFGWGTQAFPMKEGEYTMFTRDGVPFAGVMKACEEGKPTFWLNYVSVTSVDESVAKSTSLGGEVCFGPMDIEGVGRIAVIKDPQGAPLGLHQA